MRAWDAVAGVVGLLGAVSVSSCRSDPCTDGVDPINWCVGAGTCDIDGVVVKSCANVGIAGAVPDGCQIEALRRGETLTINIASLWPLLGPHDDLVLGYSAFIGTADAPPVPSFRGGKLFFDDGLEVEYDAGMYGGRSENVPRTVKRLHLRNDSPGTMSYVVGRFDDTECRLLHPTGKL